MNHEFWVITPRYLDITPRVQQVITAMQEDPACRYVCTAKPVSVGEVLLGTVVTCEGDGIDAKVFAKKLAQHFKEMNITTWALADRRDGGWRLLFSSTTGITLFEEVEKETWS